MSFDPVTYSAVQQLKDAAVPPKYQYVWQSSLFTAERNGTLVMRALGAGGGGTTTNPYRGGSGGTVALKTVGVSQGDEIEVTIPAGGAANADGGTLIVKLNGAQVLAIPGGKQGGVGPNDDPTGADWFVLGGVSTGRGGGGAMIVEGGTAAGTASGYGGAGALGNGGTGTSGGGGGALFNSVGPDGGGGFLASEMCVLRLSDASLATDGTGSTTGLGGGIFGGGGGGSGTGGNGGSGWVTLEWRYS